MRFCQTGYRCWPSIQLALLEPRTGTGDNPVPQKRRVEASARADRFNGIVDQRLKRRERHLCPFWLPPPRAQAPHIRALCLLPVRPGALAGRGSDCARQWQVMGQE